MNPSFKGILKEVEEIKDYDSSEKNRSYVCDQFERIFALVREIYPVEYMKIRTLQSLEQDEVLKIKTNQPHLRQNIEQVRNFLLLSVSDLQKKNYDLQ